MKNAIEISNYEDVDLFVKTEIKKFEKDGMILMKKTALHIMDAMKRYINPAIITGRLHTSVHVEQSGSGSFPYTDKEGNSFDGKFETNAKENEILVGTNVEYAENADEHSRAKGYFRRAAMSGEDYLDKLIKRQ